MKRAAVIAVVLAVLTAAAAPASGQSLDSPVALDPLRWLPAGADIASALSHEPRQQLRSVTAGGKSSDLALLGELAFRSPRVFGGLARKAGLSCQTCHPGGHRNGLFFVPGLSSRPGSFDASNGLFNAEGDDGRLNAVDIPSLRGVSATPPYGRDGRIASLREFVRHVAVVEFSGREPEPWLLDAIEAYLGELDFLPRRPAGKGEAAARGMELFNRPFPGRPDLSCAACHPADGLLTDRRFHDVGTGGAFDTPSLLNVAASAPYFHDGRAADLAAVVSHFDRQFGLGLDDAGKRDLVAYLEWLGAAPEPDREVSLASAVSDVARFLPLLRTAIAQQHDGKLAFIAGALRHQFGLIHERLPAETAPEARQVLVGWSRAVQDLAGAWLADGPDGSALRQYEALETRVLAETPAILLAEPVSLYAAARLREAFPQTGR